MISLLCPECFQSLHESSLECAAGHKVKVSDGIIELYSEEFRKKLEQFLVNYHRAWTKLNSAWTENEMNTAPFFYSGERKKEWAYRRKSLTVTKDVFRSEKKLYVLEIGPWNGWLSRQILKAGHRLITLDYFREKPYGLKSVNDIPGQKTCIQTNLSDLSLINEKFDLIIVNHCLQFMEDPLMTISHLKKKLLSGGKLFIIGSPVYLQSQKKAQKIQLQKKLFLKEFGFDLYFQAGKGYLDAHDRDALIKEGVHFKMYPGAGIKNFVSGMLSSRPLYLFGEFRNDVDNL